MDEVRIVGFTGVLAYRYASIQYAHEPSLIKAGHIAVSLDEGTTLYGFRPIPEAVRALPPTQDILEYLLQGHVLPGGVYDDTAVFWRAHQLARLGAPTQVWQQIIPVSQSEFVRIEQDMQVAVARGSTLGIYYRLSGKGPMTADHDNCVTWIRHLGLPVPDDAGRLSRAIRVLKQHGHPWP